MLKELNSLINVRNFLTMLINDMTINNLPQEKWSAINKKLTMLTKQITNMALELDVEKIVSDAQNFGDSSSATLLNWPGKPNPISKPFSRRQHRSTLENGK